MKQSRPFGKDQTQSALLEAADYLFGEKGPNAVTVRDISARANVNHALLHRHFGSKEALLSAIIDQHMQQFKQDLSSSDNLQDAVANVIDSLGRRPAFTRIFAHLILDHRPLEQFVSKAGTAADIADSFVSHGIALDEARKYATIISSFGLGWSLFKGFATYASSCETSEEELDEAAKEMMQKMVSLALEGKKSNTDEGNSC